MAVSWHFTIISCYAYMVFLVLSQQDSGFVQNGFSGADLHLDGSAKVLANGLLQLTNTTSGPQSGRAFFKHPFKFNYSPFDGSFASLSFSTNFVFAMVPILGNPGGHGITFFISPSMDFGYAQGGPFFGIFNDTTDGNSSNHVLAIEFDSSFNSNLGDLDGNHVGIDINSVKSVEAAPASYFSNVEGTNKSLRLLSGEPIRAWIEYDGREMLLNVTIAPARERQRPNRPLLSTSLNLSEVFVDTMYVGFSAASGALASGHYVLGWSFNKDRVSGDLEISKLPSVPRTKTSQKPSASLIILLVFVAVALMAIIVGVYYQRRKKYAEIREEWEKEYGPHRFSYISLYKATKGFDKKAVLGRGGFGEVYRGVLSSNKQIAVKRVCHDAGHGMKQFVAEIVSMGRLKHRNLVPLLGYCRRRGELLLVSEYMPNGSLDRYLFSNEKQVLPWSQRLNILRDIASVLDYLHRGVDQVVLHRDMKASNVMLDADMNGRLGDFGMAKFYEHGADPQTTKPVGTMGYMAPELIVSGPSTRTDVFGFGAFVLEVACGRRPVDPEAPLEKKFLVNWVAECWKIGSLLDATDPRLGRDYVVEEAEMVLMVGLLCSHLIPESRPTMEQVVQYMNGSLDIPNISSYIPGVSMFTSTVQTSSEIESTSASLSLPSDTSSTTNSIYVTHSIVYGRGR